MVRIIYITLDDGTQEYSLTVKFDYKPEGRRFGGKAVVLTVNGLPYEFFDRSFLAELEEIGERKIEKLIREEEKEVSENENNR